MSKPFTISETARRAGLSAYQVRAYVQMGLITPCGHMPGGYQLFDTRGMGHLRLIASAQRAGIPLKDIAPLIRALACGDWELFLHAYRSVDKLMTERCREIRQLRRKLERLRVTPTERQKTDHPLPTSDQHTSQELT